MYSGQKFFEALMCLNKLCLIKDFGRHFIENISLRTRRSRDIDAGYRPSIQVGRPHSEELETLYMVLPTSALMVLDPVLRFF